MKIALIIFTKNEKDNLQNIFKKVPVKIVDKVYAVDANSTDGTQEFLAIKKIPIIKQKYKGVGGAYEAAFSKTKEDALVFFHPDGNMNPKDIYEFVKRLKNNQEFIVATRMIKGAKNEDDNKLLKPRKWFCQVLGVTANLLWSKKSNKTTDITQGYRAITRNVYKRMNIKIPNPIAPDYEQVIRALKFNIKINEFPTIEGKRVYGDTSMKSIPTGIANVKVLFKELLNEIKPITKMGANNKLLFVLFLALVAMMLTKSVLNTARISNELFKKPQITNVEICAQKFPEYYINKKDGDYLYALYRYKSLGIKCRE